MIKTGGVLVKLLLHLAAGCLFAKHFEQQFINLRFAEHRPGHRRLLQDGAADGFSLLLLALKFELARFFLPVLKSGLFRCHLNLTEGHVEQSKERMPGVRLDDVDIPDRAR